MKKTMILSFALAALFAGCAKQEKKAAIIPPTPAQLTKAVAKDLSAYLSTLGTTASLCSVNIVPQVSGQMLSVNFKQGDYVKKGQVLAVIDKRPYEAALKQAEGNLKQARAQLKIDQLDAERNKKLAKDGYVDKQTYDSLLAKVEVDKGMVDACQGAYEDAKIKLDWCDVRAPTDGKLGLYNIDEGNIVSAGTSVITTVEYVDKLYVDFVIPSQSLNETMKLMKERGGKLDVWVSYIEDNMKDKSRKAEVGIVLNKIRYETGTAILRGELENEDHLFWPDQPVGVKVNMRKIDGAVLVPDICVQNNNAGPYVYVATPYKGGVFIVEQRQVSKGQLYEGDMRQIGGVKAGEWVVLRISQLRLQAGPFVYMASENGMIIGEDGKIISDPAKIRQFIADTSKICGELRAEIMKKKAQEQSQAAQAEASMKAAIESVENAQK